MANLIELGTHFYTAKAAARETQEGRELSQRKDAFKKAFISYLNWGGKHEVSQVQEKTLENKGLRKMNEWTLQKQRAVAEAPILTRVWNAVCNFFLAILSCFYTPAFPTDKKEAFETYYSQVHQGENAGSEAVQAARAAKHAFKDAFRAATQEVRTTFFAANMAMSHKAGYWAHKLQA